MNCIVPFTKDIDFKSNIGEVTSISLEHNYNVNDNAILGDFIISGTYKTHELSVNEENFNYILPFNLNIDNKVDINTLKFSIDNFTYEIIKPMDLRININYIITADEIEEKEEIFEKEPETIREVKIEELSLLSEDVENKEKTVNEEILMERDNLLEEENKNMILNMSANNEETFITYRIHQVKEGETAEKISKDYNILEAKLIEYNMNIKFIPGDKVLIPEDE